MILSLVVASAGVVADVRETPHNLIRSRDKSVSEKQVCVFCHTPVNESEDSAAGSANAKSVPAVRTSLPAWQKSLSDGFVYTIYDDIGRLGLGKSSVGSQSIACLSCHDANQAANNAQVSIDHPFGVPYRGATKELAALGPGPLPKGDGRSPFREAQHLLYLDDFRDVSQGVIENRRVFWVSRTGTTARRTRADLPLYGRVIGNMGGGSELAELEGIAVPHIECSSCHDPHTNTVTFLRVSPEESKLCLTCHDK